MRKVAFFLPCLAGGGAERESINLAEGFLCRGLEVDFVLARKTGPLVKDVPRKAGVVDLSARRTLTALVPLAAYLRREKPIALIAVPDHANLVAIWAKMLASSQTRVLISNHINLSYSIRNTRKVQEKIYPFLLHLFYRQADALVSVSRGAADDMARIARIPRECIRVIYNPFPLDEIARLGAMATDHPWFAPGEPSVILAAGRLTAQKDYPTLMKAFASLRKNRPARLVILGEGEEHPRLLALATKLGIRADIDLPGFLDRPYPLMARCRVFVLSSAWEGFPNVLVEALACGTQVVSTDCPNGPAEILDDGKYGHLVPVGDAVALAQAIEAALDHPSPVKMLRQRAQVFYGKDTARQYLEALGIT